MLVRSQWQHLIPHRDAMCLLDTVRAWDDERIHATAISHGDSANPLRRGDQLCAVHLCEYGAQAMALHGGLLAQRAGRTARPGLLVSLRAVQLHVARVDDLRGTLDVHAERLLAGESGWQYAFRVEHTGRVLAEGRATVMVPSGQVKP